MAFDALFATGMQALFFLTMLFFVIYSVSVAYHWFTYGTSRSLSMLSLAVYLFCSALLFLVMSLALSSL